MTVKGSSNFCPNGHLHERIPVQRTNPRTISCASDFLYDTNRRRFIIRVQNRMGSRIRVPVGKRFRVRIYAHMLHSQTASYSEVESLQRFVVMNKISHDVCRWQEEAFKIQKAQFDKPSHARIFKPGDIICVSRQGHLRRNFSQLLKAHLRCRLKSHTTFCFATRFHEG
jgi:hypothetical protein